MGTSKTSLITGIYIILGLYTFAFNNTEETTSKLAYTAGNQTQAEQLAKTGVCLALLSLKDYDPSVNFDSTYFTTQSQETMGGSVDYNATVETGLASDERQINSIGTIGSGDTEMQVTMTAIVHYTSGRWEIERSYLN